MKNRKGVAVTLETVVLIGAILLTVFIVLWVFRGAIGNFKDGIMCSGEDMSCARPESAKDPCGEGKSKVTSAVLGCFGGGKVCCAPDEDTDGGDGGSGSTPTIRNANVQVVSLSGSPIASGRTVTAIPEEGQSFTVTANYDKDNKDVSWKVSAVVQDSRGNVLENVFKPSLQSVIDGMNKEIKSNTGNVVGKFENLRPKADFTGERLKLTIAIFPVDKTGGEMTLEQSISKYPGKTQTHILYFDVKPALRYAGLTQQWTQSKTVRAACEFVDCDGIFFKIVDAPKEGENLDSMCTALAPKADKLKTAPVLKEASRYCVFENSKKQAGTCVKTLNECLDKLDAVENPGYGTAYEALMSFVRNGLIDESDFLSAANQFASIQSQTSGAICLREEPEYNLNELDNLYKAELDPVSDRASFDLDLPFMTNQFLCVYGAVTDESGNWVDNKVYSAGPPQRIKVDRNPPRAEIEFKPLKLDVNFRCFDYPENEPEKEGSGCKKDAYWVGYVNNIASFVPALTGGSKMNAVAWCPPYQSSSGYSFTSKSQIKYQGNELRVMCLRVEDEAGNAAVTMATVYNGYDMLAGAVGAYLND